jgi:glutaconyl-CoA/methylmalonyl-CoA decarboxylase subunit gamma
MEKHFRITVDGRQYDVTVEDLSEGGGQLYPQPGSMSIPTGAAPAAAPVAATTAPAMRGPTRAGDVTSTLGGVVESILVTVGQQVNQGEKMVIIEAMKMKTPMIAHRNGTVTEVVVKVGEAVDAGQILVTLA